jgi:hypothetical protein
MEDCTWAPDLSLYAGQWVTPITTLRGHWVEKFLVVARAPSVRHVFR